MKFKRISAIILAISLILTVNAAAHDSSAENPASAQTEAELQTSYDRTDLTPAEERAIIKRWLEEYPEATVGVCNGMLVLDTRPLSDFSTESEPAYMPGFSMEEYLEENPMTEADDIVSQTEEQPAELSMYDKIQTELFISMNSEQRIKAIENDFLTGISPEAHYVAFCAMTEEEQFACINKYLEFDIIYYSECPTEDCLAEKPYA